MKALILGSSLILIFSCKARQASQKRPVIIQGSALTSPSSLENWTGRGDWTQSSWQIKTLP